MLNLVLSRTRRNLPSHSIVLHRCYHVGKAGAVHTAIQRSLRKSKGMALRASTKRPPSANDAREKYRVQHGILNWVDPPKDDSPRDDYDRDFKKKSRKRADRSVSHWTLRGKTKMRKMRGKTDTRDPRIRIGKRLIAGKGADDGGRAERPARSAGPHDVWDDLYPSLSFKRGSSRSKFGNAGLADRRPLDRPASQGDPEPFDRSSNYGSRFHSANVLRDERSSSNGPKFTRVADNRFPLSIPYTTPASEFLYGTSVVKSALRSRREPRRKLYKLYIYTGENREDIDQDARLEMLAKRNGVEVVRAGNEWLRVMDKMSGGRPHNGYILEASPLPRLPVTGLGELMTVDAQEGFEVSIEYQSEEEAEVNGTSNFVNIQRNRHGRKPFVLLLDSIMDPGNLGGILRTAAFLGVTAIAISARNSASFTPVVLKASAGASEDVTLFTVKNPAGFVVNSKKAGWKVFAAVAPAEKPDPAVPAPISTEQLDDPLSEDPCILMLGSEGEGLRWNLRSKADVELYIEGSRQSHNVDSLNVSVAAGILCFSFLNRSKPKEAAYIRQEQKADKKVPETVKLF
ncbi:hypothetical protein F5882DRAFT_397011 [Hyaloscypha sp. PMI_1271]|nr:hypothetical protein F5882DRAFT_397011 [Hyaloscypha sp. PMI_1271]